MAGKYQSFYVNLNDRKQTRSKSRFFTWFVVAVVSLCVFGGLGKVYMDRRTKTLLQQWQKKYEQHSVLKKEAENLIIQQERLMNGHHILVAAERLKLRPSEPGQVRVMKVKPLDRLKEKPKQNSLLASR